MTEAEALSQARSYLKSRLDVEPCPDIPKDLSLPGFDAQKEFLFVIGGVPLATMVGCTHYLAVSKADGSVRYAGSAGE
jgi:hypothetical protein